MQYDTLGNRIVELYDNTTGQTANPKSIFQKLIEKNKMYYYYN